MTEIVNSFSGVIQSLEEQRRTNWWSLKMSGSSRWEAEVSRCGDMLSLFLLNLMYCSPVWYVIFEFFSIVLSNNLFCLKVLDSDVYYWLPWNKLVKLETMEKLVVIDVLIFMLEFIIWTYDGKVVLMIIVDKRWVPPSMNCCGLELPLMHLLVSSEVFGLSSSLNGCADDTCEDVKVVYGCHLLVHEILASIIGPIWYDLNLADSSFSSEVLSVLGGLKWCIRSRILSVKIRSDCLPLIQAINQENICLEWESLNLVEEIVNLGKTLRCYVFEWIPRSCNMVSDWCAHAALWEKCSKDWVLNPPSPLAKVLAADSCSARKDLC